jgi:hypothetical protein
MDKYMEKRRLKAGEAILLGVMWTWLGLICVALASSVVLAAAQIMGINLNLSWLG